MSFYNLTEYDPHLRPDEEQRKIIDLILSTGAERIAKLDNWLTLDPPPDFENPQLRELLPSIYLEILQHQPSYPALDTIRHIYIAHMARITQQRKLWENLLTSLQAAGLSPVLLKGNSVVDTYYQNPIERPMSDADILVTIEEQARAHEVLLSQGWALAENTSDMLDARIEHAAAYGHKKVNFASVDLHTHVMSKYPIAAIDQWYGSQTESFSYGSTQTRRFNPTALLTHTVLHGLRWEPQTPTKWIIDAVRICRSRGQEINWETIVSFGREHQVLQRLSLGLLYLNEEFQVEIPANVVELLKGHQPSRFEKFENDYLLKDRPYVLTGFSSIKRLLHLIVWRAMRMGNNYRLPANILVVCIHMVGSGGFFSIGKRLTRYATRNR